MSNIKTLEELLYDVWAEGFNAGSKKLNLLNVREQTLAQIEQSILTIIGDELDEGDGWDWAFGKEAKCCPGDDFAYYGNHIKKLQRQALKTFLGTKGGERNE